MFAARTRFVIKSLPTRYAVKGPRWRGTEWARVRDGSSLYGFRFEHNDLTVRVIAERFARGQVVEDDRNHHPCVLDADPTMADARIATSNGIHY